MLWFLYALLSALSFGVQDTMTYGMLQIHKFGPAAVNGIVHTWIAILTGIIIGYGKYTGSHLINKIYSDIGYIWSNNLIWSSI